MSFEPKKITKEHILKAVERIKEEQLELNESIIWDVEINGELYPPKEVMKYAHEEMNGERIWKLGGGSATNKYLSKYDFPIIDKSKGGITKKMTNKERFAKLVEDVKRELKNKHSVLKDFKFNKTYKAFVWISDHKGVIGNIEAHYEIQNAPTDEDIQVVLHFEKKSTNKEFYNSSVFNIEDRDHPYIEWFRWDKAHSLRYKTRFKINEENIVENIIEALQILEDELGERTRQFIEKNKKGQIKEKILDKVIRLYKKHIGKDSLHCNLSKDGPFLKRKLELKSLVDDFVNDSTEEKFKRFWHSSYIDSAARSAISQRIIDKYGIEVLRKHIVENIIPLQDFNEAYDSKVKKMALGDFKKTFFDLYYIYHLRENIFPNHNVPATDTIKLLSTIRPNIFKNENVKTSIDTIGDLLYNNDGFKELQESKELPKYYVIDQFCNLIQKTKVEELDSIDDEFKDLYSAVLELKSGEHIIDNEINTSMKNIELNQILFGPPGTGKTYNTINEALKIVDPVFYKENKDDRDALKERFNLLLIKRKNDSEGQIAFTTFHQSFSYEDFVEGIKPVEPKDGDQFLKYKIEEGVFKKICRLANDSIKSTEIVKEEVISLDEENYIKAQFYKLSLGDTENEYENEVYDYCIKNNCIAVKKGDNIDFSEYDEEGIKKYGKEHDLSSGDIQAINYFKNFIKAGNYVVISKGNNYVRAIGKVIGDYRFSETSPFINSSNYVHFRDVEWIIKDKEIPINDIYSLGLTEKTIYKLRKEDLKKEFFVKEEISEENVKLPKKPKNYVLIIDEINRGNVSSIFGELITLIEKDKRAGGDEKLSVILPYSKESFSVPSNLYIIGTMNTADRSIEALDTALRRRFSFKEMPPKMHVILNEASNAVIKDIDLANLLEVINLRIEKLIDRDHMIGHSYFLKIDSFNDLRIAFKDKIIPLLEEYFYGDYGKINLILGNAFVEKKNDEGEFSFAKNANAFESDIVDDLKNRTVFTITKYENWTKENFIEIYK